MTDRAPATIGKSDRGVRSQTLERGIDTLQLLADGKHRSTQEIAGELGLHRSVIYRILRTLEDYSLIGRDGTGKFVLGLGIAALAESSMGGFQAEANALLTDLANATGASAFMCTVQKDDAVVVLSARPSATPASVVIRPGTRLPLLRGAPGLAILALRDPEEGEQDEVALARSTNIVRTKSEPFGGFETVSTPLSIMETMQASLSVVFPIGEVDQGRIERELKLRASRFGRPDEVWEI